MNLNPRYNYLHNLTDNDDIMNELPTIIESYMIQLFVDKPVNAPPPIISLTASLVLPFPTSLGFSFIAGQILTYTFTVKILNLYIILSCYHLYHFFPVSIHYLQCIHCLLNWVVNFEELKCMFVKWHFFWCRPF